MIDRITILGGSSVYIPEFILSAVSHNLKVREIVLLGRPGRKLDLVARFSQRLIHKSGFPIRIIPCTDIREAVAGAKYIVNHVRVGGMQARMRDEKIPPAFDMIGDETIGAGGFANAMRTLPVVLDFAQDIQEINPGAIIINLTNPMGIVMEALVRYTSLTAVGICDLPWEYARKIANLLQQEPENLRFDYIGLYHLGWIQDIRVDGRSRMSQVLELLEAHPEDDFDYELIELFRMIPTKTTGMYFRRAEILKRQQGCSRFRSDILVEAERQILDLYESNHLVDLPELTRQRNAVWYEESIIPMILALESDREREMVVCVRNEGSIRDLPENCSVEVPATISRRGIQPRKVGSLPGFLKGMFVAAKESDRLAVEAVRHKSYESALQALAINPFVPSIDVARRFLDRIVKEEKLELH
jgi:6-phospho-beta-glucosidase